METLYIAFLCVLPFIIYLLLGMISKRFFKIKTETYFDLNKISFYYFLPASLFLNVYQADYSQVTLSTSIILAISGSILVFLISMIVYGLRRNMRDEDKSVMIQNAFRANFILFGIPLTENILGRPVSGLAGIIMVIVIPLFNVFAIIALSIYSKNKKSFFEVFIRIIKNPLIVAAILAFLFRFFHISIPVYSVDIIRVLATMATPLSLIALGGRFTFTSSATDFRRTIEACFVRLILVPAILLSISIYLGVRGEALALLMVLFGGPVAVSSYTMASQMNANEKLAGQILVYTSLLSNFSLFLFISYFKYKGYL